MNEGESVGQVWTSYKEIIEWRHPEKDRRIYYAMIIFLGMILFMNSYILFVDTNAQETARKMMAWVVMFFTLFIFLMMSALWYLYLRAEGNFKMYTVREFEEVLILLEDFLKDAKIEYRIRDKSLLSLLLSGRKMIDIQLGHYPLSIVVIGWKHSWDTYECAIWLGPQTNQNESILPYVAWNIVRILKHSNESESDI